MHHFLYVYPLLFYRVIIVSFILMRRGGVRIYAVFNHLELFLEKT